MAQQRKTFGRLAGADASAGSSRGPAAPARDAGTSDATIENYDWIAAPVREGRESEAAHDAAMPDRVLKLFTTSPYSRWLWVIGGIVAFLAFQFGLLGGGIVMPERSGRDYVAGNAPREAAHIVDFSVDAEAFHEEDHMMVDTIVVSGTLINTTNERIWQVTLRAFVHDCAGKLEAEACPVAWDGILTLAVDVPPGSQASLDKGVPVGGLPLLRGEPFARYEMLAVSTR